MRFVFVKFDGFEALLFRLNLIKFKVKIMLWFEVRKFRFCRKFIKSFKTFFNIDQKFVRMFLNLAKFYKYFWINWKFWK